MDRVFYIKFLNKIFLQNQSEFLPPMMNFSQ